MLDFTTRAADLQPAAIDTIYKAIIDDGDIDGALAALLRLTGADGMRLSHVGRGREAILAEIGTHTGQTRHDLHHIRLDGPVSDTGRRLVLDIVQAEAPAEDAVGRVRDLLSHLDRAVGVSSRLAVTEVERRLGSDLLDRLCVGSVFLDADRQVVATTGMAQSLIASGAGLRQRAGRLAAVCDTEDRLLQSAIKAALAEPATGASDVLRIHPRQSDRALGIVVQPIQRSARTGDIACAVVIRGNDQLAPPRTEMLRNLFDLTPAEANLTSILAMGLTLDEAAEELAISRNTARAHLRAIFSKCGINRQIELVRLVLTSVAMLGQADQAA